jgi:hypothetical protein
MLLESGAGVNRRCPRGWAALAAGGVLSVAVLLSGLGIASAQDEKPRPQTDEKRVEQEKAEQERKAAQEAERAARAARDRQRAERDRERAAGQDVAALKRAIAAAAEKGDAAEVRRLADRLERAMGGQRGDRPRDPNQLRDPERPRPPVPPVPPRFPGFPGVDPFGGFDAPHAEQMKKAMEQAEKALQEAMERLKDNPEAREQVQRALEAYRKGMEEGRKRAAEARDRFQEWRKANPDAPFPPGVERLDDLQKELQQRFGPDWQKRFGEDFGRDFGRGFEGFRGPEGFGRRPGSPRFGVAVSPVTEALAEQLDLPTDRGVVVVQVIPGSAAEKAGVKKNDVVLMFAGQEIGGDVNRFAGAVEKAKAGEKVEVVVLRKGKKETLKGVELPEAPKRDRKADNFREFRFPEGGRFKVPAPAKGFEKMSVQISDDEFTIDATKGDTRYRLSGTVEGGKPTPSRIRVGEESYKSLEDVPEEHRAAVKQLLGSVGGAR